MTDLRFHEVANIFPLMQGADFDALQSDIAQHGLNEAIWLHPDGSIIDGRNRYRACKAAGVKPRFQTYKGDSPVAFSVSQNLKRRHLNNNQSACVGVDILPMLEAEAAERQKAAGVNGANGGRGNRKTLEATVPQGFVEKDRAPQARDAAAAVVGVSGRQVGKAKAVAIKAPDLFEQVRAGDISLTQAERAIKDREKREAPPLPSDKYRVLYADPPWKYGNTMPDYVTEQADYYPLMTIKEIAALPIKDMSEDDAVLFLWVTSPILEESFQVINAWGFKYKASFIWDKVKHNMGHYNSVRHEFLLIAVRGSCQPDVQKLFDSVVSVERTEHSVKPEIFREIIDTIYPLGRRIELFARRQVDKWEAWGNELRSVAATV